MWDQSAYNAGFVVVRPTWYGRRVYELIRRKTKASKKLDDQTALNHVIAHMKRSYKENEFTAVVLNVRRYLCGVNYFESTVDRWFTDRQRLQLSCRDDAASCPIVVHNNWIVSREAKIFRFKEHLMWMYDKGRFVSCLSVSAACFRPGPSGASAPAGKGCALADEVGQNYSSILALVMG